MLTNMREFVLDKSLVCWLHRFILLGIAIILKRTTSLCCVHYDSQIHIH